MNVVRSTLAALAVVIGSGIGFMAASAANSHDCSTMATRVEAAIRTYSTYPHIDEAKSEQQQGAQLCADGKFDKGIGHFRRALILLGLP
jgi:hypothetical protein